MSTDKIVDLKAKFVAGAIPLESDYATLLNMLEETRVATGTSPDTPAGDTGLEIDDNTKGMKVKLASDGLLEVNPKGLAMPMTSRLRLACGLLDDRPALYGVTNGTYVVAVPRPGYTLVHLFPAEGKIVLNKKAYTSLKHGGKNLDVVDTGYTNLPLLNVLGNLQMTYAVWPVEAMVGDVVSIPISETSYTFDNQAFEFVAPDVMGGVVDITLEVLP